MSFEAFNFFVGHSRSNFLSFLEDFSLFFALFNEMGHRKQKKNFWNDCTNNYEQRIFGKSCTKVSRVSDSSLEAKEKNPGKFSSYNKGSFTQISQDEI